MTKFYKDQTGGLYSLTNEQAYSLQQIHPNIVLLEMSKEDWTQQLITQGGI